MVDELEYTIKYVVSHSYKLVTSLDFSITFNQEKHSVSAVCPLKYFMNCPLLGAKRFTEI